MIGALHRLEPNSVGDKVLDFTNPNYGHQCPPAFAATCIYMHVHVCDKHSYINHLSVHIRGSGGG